MSLSLVEPPALHHTSFNVPGRWARDKEIVELIEHLDQLQDDCWDDGRRRYNVDLLPTAERDEVVTQISLCQESFAYAARNFFWILPKRGDEIPFQLWESQELVLDVMARRKAAGKAQRLMIIKARQLGMSTLIEALIAWRTMFFPNARGLVVSDDQDNSAELFSKLLHIYDHMPWWLKPMLDRRKEERLLVFDNPDDDMKDKEPGLHSRVAVQSASKLTSVGQGRTLNCVHVSEFCDYEDRRAKEIIQEDLHAAIADDPETFAFLESTAKGAGRFAHKFWRRQCELGERAHWYPLFLPWFMEKTRVMAPPGGWKPDVKARDMRERASRDWVRCTSCMAYCEQGPKSSPLTGEPCYHCNSGIFEPVSLTDEQLYWMKNETANMAIDSESRKILAQEMCVAGSQRVSTDIGIIPISRASLARMTETGAVSRWIVNGRKDTVKVSTKSGRHLIVTADHEIQLSNGSWKQAGSLSTEDILKLSPPRFSDTYCTVTTGEWAYGATKSIIIDELWGRFLGYFMGDGCFYNSKITVACDAKDQDIMEDVCGLIRAILGKEAQVESHGGMSLVVSVDNRWGEIMGILGCSTRYESRSGGLKRKVHVPDCIWRSPRSVVKEFLSALIDCDGHAYRDTPKTSFFTKYREFAEDVQLLLLGFGINSEVKSENKTNSEGRTYIGNVLNMKVIASNLFHQEIGFISNRKSGTACVRDSKRKGGWQNLMEDGVLSVDPNGEEDVYDLTVPGESRFGANGIMVHNCLTAEEAFQLSGYQLFPEECIKFVASTIDKTGFLEGHFDNRGVYHAMVHRNGVRVCCAPSCPFDHSSEMNLLHVWEEPVAGCAYVVGADVAEGLGGNADHSVAWVNRIGGFGSPDVHVATFRSNEIDPISFGDFLNFLGRWYNEALMSVEVNKFDSCFSRVRTFHMYSNNYRWKHVDSTRVESNKWGWWTTMTTKPRLWQTSVARLKERGWIIRSENFYEEMLTFQKESPEDRGASAEDNFYDDEIMAGMIAYYTSHDMDWDENLGSVPVRTNTAGAVAENGQYAMSCDVCGHRWVSTKPISDNPHENKCPNQNTGPNKNLPCRSLRIRGKLVSQESGTVMDWHTEINIPPEGNQTPSYDEL